MFFGEVFDVFYYLDVSKVIGFDKILVKLLKNCVLCIFNFFCVIFNKCFYLGKFLVVWKVVNIILILKSGYFGEVFNYRFIFLLFIVFKVMECCVYN